jgi:hypothetical protein
MQAGSLSREPFSRQRRTIFFALLSVFFFSTQVKAQDDVAEAARQERARKAGQQNNPQHVYTDEDLKKNKILVPADQARVEARKKQNESAPEPKQNGLQNAPQNATVVPAPGDPNSQTESLGEVARRYRAEKAAREAAEAAAKNLAPFPYAVTKPEPALAEPKPEIAPVAPGNPGISVRKHVEVSPLAPRVSNVAKNGRVRISPFQPRPFDHPIAPVQPAPVAPAKPAERPTTRIAPIDPKPPFNAEHSVTANRPVVASPKLELQPLLSIRVEHGDSWWKLAQRHLGSGARWPELRAINAASADPADYLPFVSPSRQPRRRQFQRKLSP